MRRRCPICHRVIDASLQAPPEAAEYSPFCSKRCKLVDLGAWLDSTYVIISEQELQEPDGPPEAPGGMPSQ